MGRRRHPRSIALFCHLETVDKNSSLSFRCLVSNRFHRDNFAVLAIHAHAPSANHPRQPFRSPNFKPAACAARAFDALSRSIRRLILFSIHMATPCCRCVHRHHPRTTSPVLPTITISPVVTDDSAEATITHPPTSSKTGGS